MQIQDSEIASTEPFGMLDGKQVNLIKLRGGLNLATTLDTKGSPQVLGAASHQAILCYTVEQRFPSFQPMIMKSEGIKLSAESHSHFLTDDLRKSGHDIYSVQNGNDVDFYITKQNIKVACVSGSIKDTYLLISPLNVPKECVTCISSAIAEKALNIGLKTVRSN